MSIRRWLQGLRTRAASEAGEARLPADLKLVRLYRTIRDFPGRTDADLARIIYGHADAALVLQDASTLEGLKMVVREAQTGRLFAISGLHV